MSDATVTGSTDDGAGATPDPEDHAAPEAYTVLGELGRGGMGRVLRARDERLGREVAIKKLLGTGLGAHLRFEREARITARLQHPAIVPIYEVSTLPSGDPYYAMKLVSGETLAAKILAAPGFSARLALLRHVVVAAEAIAYAHSRGVIHRDLKASNVVVGELGETVVIVLVAATTRELIRWDLAEDRRERVRVPADIWAIGVAPDGETLAALDTDDRLYLLAGDRVRLLLESGATTPSFSGDGAHLASCDADGGARVFRVADGAPLAIPEAEVCAFSPDGARLVLGARDGDAWSCALPDARCTKLDGGRGATLLAAGDDGRVVAALHGGAIVTWDDAGAPRRDLGRHRAEVTLLALSPDGRSLASGGSGPEVHLWDLASGQGRRLRGALAQPTALAFAGDRVRVVDWYAIHELRDDLPRDEPGLRAAIDRALQSGQ